MTSQFVQNAGPQPPVSGHQQVIIYTNTIRNSRNILADFDPKVPRLLGIVKIVLALFSVMLNAIAIVKQNQLAGYGTAIFIIGFGYWCPLFYIISGSIAVGTAKKKTWAMVRALLGMSILSVIMGIMQFASLTPAAVIVSEDYGYHCGYGCDGKDDEDDAVAGVTALAVLLLLIGLAEAALSIWLCKLCGDHICCTQHAPVAVYTTNNAAPGNGYSNSMNLPQSLPVHGTATVYPAQQQSTNTPVYPQHQGYFIQGGALASPPYAPQQMMFIPAAATSNIAFEQSAPAPQSQAVPDSLPPTYEEDINKTKGSPL